MYLCAGCGAKLFPLRHEVRLGTGWPSFYAPADGEAVETERATGACSFRTEVHCAVRGGHLGYVRRRAGADRPALLHFAALELEREDGEPE